MIATKNLANAVAAKTARACDSCIKRRARWYCAADDAFLCQPCDASVHSANPLARRHQRLRLKTASSSSSCNNNNNHKNKLCVSWHRGFTKKPRTRRHGKCSFKNTRLQNTVPLPLVPEVGADDLTSFSHEENEEEHTLLYRVPVYDPDFLVDDPKSGKNSDGELSGRDQSKGELLLSGYSNGDVDSFHGFLPSDMDLADFAADVESLLGKGFENESNFAMEELGLVAYDKEVKAEDKEIIIREKDECEKIDHYYDDDALEKSEEPFQLNLDYYDSPATCPGEEEEIITNQLGVKQEVGNENSIIGGFHQNQQNEEEEEEEAEAEEEGENMIKKKKNKIKILLSLDYEAVISAWACQRSPWTTGTGDRPDFDPDHCFPDCMSGCGTQVFHNPHAEMIGASTHIGLIGGGGGGGGRRGGGDGGREARVSRYREKRRTRLFSKKIRYEVRKLNAEKRPRMKGRFVKRTPTSTPFPDLFHNQTTAS